LAVLLTSKVVEEELEGAPEPVGRILDSVPVSGRETVRVDDEVHDLANAYISAGVVAVR